MAIHTFSDIIEEVKKWDDDQLVELESIIKRQLILKKRRSIKRNYTKSKAELASGKLTFSNDVNILKQVL